MSNEKYSGQPEKDLRGKLAELNAENFKSSFTSERTTPMKGAKLRENRKEIARIMTVLSGRKALDRHQAEQKKLELRLGGMGKVHEGSPEDKRRRALVSKRLADTRRAVRELASVTAEGAKPAKGKKK